MEVKMEPDLTPERFEEVYPRYEFAALVEIVPRLAAWNKKFSAHKVPPLREEDADNPIGSSHAPLVDLRRRLGNQSNPF